MRKYDGQAVGSAAKVNMNGFKKVVALARLKRKRVAASRCSDVVAVINMITERKADRVKKRARNAMSKRRNVTPKNRMKWRNVFSR